MYKMLWLIHYRLSEKSLGRVNGSLSIVIAGKWPRLHRVKIILKKFVIAIVRFVTAIVKGTSRTLYKVLYFEDLGHFIIF